MSCLIYACNGRGECIGKCDSNCYNAKTPDCDCICHGANHGVGLKKARENITKHVDEWMERYKRQNKEVKTFGFDGDPKQIKLF